MRRDFNALLIVNVGNRDLMLDGAKIEPARTRGAEIHGRLAEFRERLGAPILEPIIREVLLDEPRSLDICLLCTDQPEGTPDQHRSRDTVEFGEILVRRLPELFSDAGVAINPYVAVVGAARPNVYDEALPWIDAAVEAAARETSAPRRVYLGLSGGIPAMNTGLLLRSLHRFKGVLDVFYSDEGSRRAVRQRIVGTLSRVERLTEARVFVERCEFDHARMTLESAGFEALAIACAGAAERVMFDFEAATSRFNRLKEIDHDLAVRLKSVEPRLESLKGADSDRLRLAELFHNAELAKIQGAWVDYMGRMRALFELAIFFYAEKVMRVALPPKKERNKFEVLSLLKKDYKANRELISLFHEFESMTKKRNETIIAHGFKTVNESDRRKLEESDIGRKFLARMGFETGRSPYLEMSEAILRVIEAEERKVVQEG